MPENIQTIASFVLGCLAIGLNLYVLARESRKLSEAANPANFD